MVLGGGAQHRGAADVDLLDRLRIGDLGPRDRLAKRIEVHGNEVDRRDAVLGEVGAVARMVAPRQQAAVHRGVQRLEAALHHLGHARDPVHGQDRNPRLPQRLGRAAGRDEFPAERHELPGEGDEAALVRDGQQRPHHASAAAWISSARLATSFRSMSSAGEWEYRMGQPMATSTTP